MIIRSIVGPVTAVAVVSAAVSLQALNVPTHRLLNRAAAGEGTFDAYTDTFDKYLRESLGLKAGREVVLGNLALSPTDLLAEGGAREDDGPRLSTKARVYRHFHNPLLPWDEAGLRSRYPFHPLAHQYTSSVRWMQATEQALDDGGAAGGEWAWHNARRLYFLSLTTEDPREREAKTAGLFRALGHLMHVVVDASVPEHVRNDPHPFGTFSREVLRARTAGNYEYWISDQQARLGDTAFRARYLSRPIGPGVGMPGLLPPQGEAVAKLPIARLLDTDRYQMDGADPNVTLNQPIGIAEFANANFFSEDTLSGVDTQDRRLPFPRRDELIQRSDLAPMSPRIRAYYQKPSGQGLATRFALAACRLDGRAAVLPPYPCVDEAVWDETASHMLPRAVGYARGVLDYFFRGSLAVSSVTWNASGVLVEVQNTSTEEMEGTFEIWARHDPDTPRERRTRLAVLGDGEPVRLRPGDSRAFEGIRIPAPAIPAARHMLVFTGRLGLEEDAVIGRAFTVARVEVRQRTYDAETVPFCTPVAASGASSSGRTTFELRRESLTCGWRIATHRVTGTLATNMPLDPATGRPEPIISRVEARWVGSATPAPLALDGRPVAGVWQRQGSEPDPTTFEIVDPTERGPFVDLYLFVSYEGGRGEVARMARFGTASVAHAKAMIIDNRVPSAPRYLVTSSRSAAGMLWYDWATGFEALSHNAVAVPTDTFTARRFGTSDIEEGVFTNQFVYLETAIDDFEEFTSGAAAESLFKAIPLRSPHPSGPHYGWTAEIRRAYRPMEQEFRRIFVDADPEPFHVRLTGQESGAAGTR